ncbi:TRAP transporter substrate-binding protein [Pikeienuella piscinae]|uniref:TRAP transporter substrate-binding protein n=1 Tax=Pikeienuella piscinae TaxID=2748098 RepID=A0A7L5BXW5_9RHOB|nr:TRAP transporter substrate-binding protein [Pikeienuella piscinae]QIE56765.1 TRAP transporter substrate-binding protein [Pikeienuella piscinae]
MDFKGKTIAVVTAGAMAALTTAGAATAETSWNMPARSNTQNYMTKNIIEFVEDVAENSGGEIKIDVHPEDSLVRQPDVLRAVQTQQVELGEYLMSMQSNLSPIFAVDAIPFLAVGYEANRKLAKAARPAIEEELAKRGVKLLFIQSWPRQGIYADKEINDLSDFDGVTMRAYNPSTARLAELMGATPVTIQQSEVPQAFATGVVEAMITSPTTGVDTQAWDFVSHFYDVEAFITWNVIVMNQDVFDGLSKDEQEAVMKASAAAEKRAWKNAPAVTEEQIATLAENGITVKKPNDAFLAGLKEIGKAMLGEWLETAGDEGQAVIDRYRAME